MGARNAMLRAGKWRKTCPGAQKTMLPEPCAPKPDAGSTNGYGKGLVLRGGP